MSRTLLLSNGELHIGLDSFGQVQDFYFPYVGQENHTPSDRIHHRVGVWVDGILSWIDEPSWQHEQQYHRHAMVGRTTATNESLNVRLEFDDCVDASQAAFIRNVHIINMSDEMREVRLFFHQAFIISNSHDSDTGQFIPSADAILHYKGHRAFVAAASHADGKPADGFSIGLFDDGSHEGTHRDAEDGLLSGNPVEHGKVDSVLSLHCHLSAHDSARIHYWVTAGTSQREAFKIHARLQKNGVLHYLLHTAHHWQQWLKPALQATTSLDDRSRKHFINSLLILKASQDKRGAVLASTDSSILNYGHDSYAYCWPRDGVYAMWPLLRLGYQDELLRFFSFMRRSLHDDGYLMHKYRADGSLGSSWHAYVHADGHSAPPIQEDETAAVLFLFGQYYDRYPDAKILQDYFVTMVAPMANFMSGYIDPRTCLPLPSYDLWEERFQTTTYTTALVYAALNEAAKLADIAGDAASAVRWRNVAEDIKLKAQQYLWNEEKGYFLRGFVRSGDDFSRDETVDIASLYGAYMFGLFESQSSHMVRALEVTESVLASSGGIARYDGDRYHQQDSAVVGNPWIITTLWYAQCLMEQGEMTRASEYLEWTLSYADMKTTSVLAEQYDARTHAIRSVSPLTWSHAELLSSLIDLTTREAQE